MRSIVCDELDREPHVWVWGKVCELCMRGIISIVIGDGDDLKRTEKEHEVEADCSVTALHVRNVDNDMDGEKLFRIYRGRWVRLVYSID